MRHYRLLLMCIAVSCFVGLVGCTEAPKPSPIMLADPGMPADSGTVAQAEGTQGELPPGEIQERGVAPRRLLPGMVLPPKTFTPPQTYVGPTENITKVANAIRLYHKSLSILITVRPGLGLTKPVNIRPAYGGWVGQQTGRGQVIQSSGEVYNEGTGFGQLFDDSFISGRPRQISVDIMLREQNPGGSPYDYTVPMSIDLEPLYAVWIDPLLFTLVETCNLIGDTEINFYWYSPDGQHHMKAFKTRGHRTEMISEFAWQRQQVGASAKLNLPNHVFQTVNLIDPRDFGLGFAPGTGPSDKNLVPPAVPLNPPQPPDSAWLYNFPVTTYSHIEDARNENDCHATVKYQIRYGLHHYFRGVVP